MKPAIDHRTTAASGRQAVGRGWRPPDQGVLR